jgi:hypothetical protein
MFRMDYLLLAYEKWLEYNSAVKYAEPRILPPGSSIPYSKQEYLIMIKSVTTIVSDSCKLQMMILYLQIY